MTRIPIAALLLAALPVFGTVIIDVSPEKPSKAGRDRESREARSDREEALYDRATDALDDHDWQRAASLFRSVANLHGEHADAALYWLAYANNKRGLRAEALASLDELKHTYPKSRWIEDGRTLEVEIRQSAGQHIEVHRLADEDEKLTILSGLMDSDPEEGVRLGREILKSTPLVKVKDGVLFVFTQSGDPRAISIVTETAKDNSRPEVQKRAIRYLAISGGEETKKALTEVYQKAKDNSVRKAVMKAYLITGDRGQLLTLAKTEPNIDLRSDAVTELGAMGARSELADLYKNETATSIRKRIIQAMFIGGSGDQVLEIAKTEKNPDLRATAIRNLGFMGGRGSAPTVASLYETETDANVKRAIISSLFFMEATSQLRELAQKEKDEDLRDEINDKLERLRE